MISKTGEAETITSHYLFALGAYRALYIVNWIYRYYYEGFYDFIAIVAGCVQTALYCDFFYLYITKGNVGWCYYGLGFVHVMLNTRAAMWPKFNSRCQHVAWVCYWSGHLLRDVFLQVLRFSPLPKTNTSKLQFDLEHLFLRTSKCFMGEQITIYNLL